MGQESGACLGGMSLVLERANTLMVLNIALVSMDCEKRN